MNCANCGCPLNVTQEEYDEWVESYGTCPRCDHPLGEPVYDEDEIDDIG